MHTIQVKPTVYGMGAMPLVNIRKKPYLWTKMRALAAWYVCVCVCVCVCVSARVNLCVCMKALLLTLTNISIIVAVAAVAASSIHMRSAELCSLLVEIIRN